MSSYATGAGVEMHHIRVQHAPFDIATEQQALWRGQPQVGAVVTFTGLTRDINEGVRIHRLTLEHYPGMTEKVLEAIADEAAGRWPVEGIRLIHRVGTLAPQDPIVFVGVAARHRRAAFAACEFLIDSLKTQAPFWKKEARDDGDHWIAARGEDEAAARRWQP
jgi:molybdopterin synthase catalytic subunit